MKPTKLESAYMGRVAELGCIVCHLLDLHDHKSRDVTLQLELAKMKFNAWRTMEASGRQVDRMLK